MEYQPNPLYIVRRRIPSVIDRNDPEGLIPRYEYWFAKDSEVDGTRGFCRRLTDDYQLAEYKAILAALEKYPVVDE